jgi:hypothetical protein
LSKTRYEVSTMVVQAHGRPRTSNDSLMMQHADPNARRCSLPCSAHTCGCPDLTTTPPPDMDSAGASRVRRMPSPAQPEAPPASVCLHTCNSLSASYLHGCSQQQLRYCTTPHHLSIAHTSTCIHAELHFVPLSLSLCQQSSMQATLALVSTLNS